MKTSGRLTLHIMAFAVMCFAFLGLPPALAQSQSQPYTLILRNVPLDQALESFVDLTGVAVAYDPNMVDLRNTYCLAKNEPIEDLLQCILDGSNLDYFRLSSGTFVLTSRVEMAAQRGYLSGSVIDLATGGPVAYAHVYLASAGIGTVTNDAGYFTFPPLPPGPYSMSVSHISYVNWRDTLMIRPGERMNFQAVLNANAISVSPVVINGLQQQLLSEWLQSPQVGDTEAPVGYAGTNGESLVRKVSGLPGVRINDVTADIFMQGGDAGEHQFRLDGVPVFLPQSVIGYVGPFSAFALNQIAVYSAGFGVEQGSQLSGVIEAEHAIEGKNGVDVQLDPISLNGRAQVHTRFGSETRASFMVAGRLGLGSLYQSSQLKSMLDQWSTADPFLVYARMKAPLTSSPNGPSRPNNGTRAIVDLTAPPNTELSFSDLHGAARFNFGLLQTLTASIYQGRNRLAGGVISREEFNKDQFEQVPVTAQDRYDWVNRTGQIRYDAVIDGRTMLTGQVRASQYTLDHGYQLIDSLAAFQNPDTPLSTITTTADSDANRIQELAYEGAIERATGTHQIRLGLDVSYTTSRFDILMAVPRGSSLGFGQSLIPIRVNRGHIRHTSALGRLGLYGRDRIQLTERLNTEVGLRLTYLPSRRTMYGEPRLSVQYDQDSGSLGRWSSRTAIGLYRQFTTQFDLSALNAGALLPSLRVWLPVGPSVSPPQALHLSQAFLFAPRPGWSVQVEGYVKRQFHLLTMNYNLPNIGELTKQANFLANAEGKALGAHLSAERKTEHVRTRAQYAYSRVERRSEALFEGQTETVPWNEPHRLEIAVDWLPTDRLTLNARWYGVWGRSWGFRQAYYDYFGHRDDTREQPPYDLGHPSDHRLPFLSQLDLGIAYTQTIGPAYLQVRADLLNALDRENVLDWRLETVYGTGLVAPVTANPVLGSTDSLTFEKTSRLLYGRLPVFAVRAGW